MRIENWAWLIVPLGMCRAVQIALVDRIFAKPRKWLLHKLNPRNLPMSDPNRPYLSYLLECPWCISVWLGIVAAILLVNKATLRPTLWVLLALALSLAAVVLDRLIDVYASDEAAAQRAAAAARAAVPVLLPPGVDDAFRSFEDGPTDDQPRG